MTQSSAFDRRLIPRRNAWASRPVAPCAGGPAFVLFVGAAEPFRGHGYGRPLLAAMTRDLISGGPTILIADTDYSNAPMAKDLQMSAGCRPSLASIWVRAHIHQIKHPRQQTTN